MAELEKWPETEEEFFVAIEFFGGFINGLEKNLVECRVQCQVQESDCLLAKKIKAAREVSGRLIAKLCETHERIIHPKDCPRPESGQPLPSAPKGRIYFCEWWEEMRARGCSTGYGQLISALEQYLRQE